MKYEATIYDEGTVDISLDGKEQNGMSCLGISISDYIKQKGGSK